MGVDVRECKKCKHYRSRWWFWFFSLPKYLREKCARSGSYAFCKIERDVMADILPDHCGQNGRFFEPKKPVQVDQKSPYSEQDQYGLNYEKETSYL
jgi:hypothetical protein